jgi:3'-phosphoadenosine 5'-phosphosulfate sulfotransferase (PAPS reductase)/FAD synthetase
MTFRERIAGKRVVASISGGKDSAAMSLWITEQGIEHDRVFLDTGWEAAETYDYLRGDLTRAIGPITEIQSARGGMVEWIRHKGTFPSKQRRWCTEELKFKPMRDHLRALIAEGVEPVNTVGIRHGESAARAKQPEWEWSDDFGALVWRPLVDWTLEDVVAIHQRHGLRPHPFYLAGAERVGCAPCVYARKAEVKLLAELTPERMALLQHLERELTERSGEPRSWFQNPLGRTGLMPIGEVILWAQTSRGGRQFELFDADDHERGCMRWGLCDTVGDREAA